METAEKISGQIPREKWLEFILAGNCTFTLKSKRTQNWYTYKSYIVEKFGETMVVVRVLTGCDNVNNFSYLGTIRTEDGMPRIFRQSSKIGEEARVFQVFNYVFENLLLRRMNKLEEVEFWHEGTCCRCGRKLTVPESIERGIGPECYDKQSKFQY